MKYVECLDTVEKLYNSGAPVAEIARRCGSVSTVYRALRVLAAQGRITARRRRKRRLTQQDLEKIAKLYMEGKSIYSIARELDRHVSTIYRALRRLGLK